jgi:hypothetical protein
VPLPHRTAVVTTAVALLVLPASAGWAAEADHPPAVPASVTVGGLGCQPGGLFVGTTTPQVTAVFADAELGVVQGEAVTPQFVVWPAGAPAQRTDWSAPALTRPGTVFTTIPSTLVDGGRYHLKARATDAAGAVSAWSPICTFTVDTTRPHPPTVTSADYPEGKPGGGVGVTGTFTFAVAGSDKDVVKFRYSSSTTGLLEVPADRRGRATVEITPDRYGTSVVAVQAIDRTGNRSAETTYSFTVIDRAPKVLDQNADAGLGVPRTIRFWSAVPGTASFTYRFNDGPATTVDADADGYGTTTVTPDRPGDNFLAVTSRTTAGVVSPETRVNLYVQVRVPRPEISSPDFPGDGTPPPTAGQQVTIVLRTDSPAVAEFVCSLDFGETEQVIAADENGNATFRHTLTGEYLEVQARARTADGSESDTVYTGWELTPAP